MSSSAEAWRTLSLVASGNDAVPQLRLLVLAAHPDDETIGVSVLLSRVPRTAVVYLTDGAPRDRRLWPETMSGSREEYAGIRTRESLRALSLAGLSDRIFRLSGVDQEAIFNAPGLASEFGRALQQIHPEAIITHPYEGGHPDHDCAALIAQRVGAARGVPVFEMTSYHAVNGRCVTGKFLRPSEAGELAIQLTPEERERKRKMFAAYASQQLVLSQFDTEVERLRPAPQYDFACPPHEGMLWYECMGWKLTGEKWRELAGKMSSKSRRNRAKKVGDKTPSAHELAHAVDHP